VNYPEESIQHSEHGENLKSRKQRNVSSGEGTRGGKLLTSQSLKRYASPKETNLEHQANEKL
jgi:hypothetical protein